MSNEIVSPTGDGRTPPFRVEVTGTWRDLRERTEMPWTQVFVVAAPGPTGAQVAGAQLFGGEAARRRYVAGPECTVRLLE